jgi:hypothetical protein
MAAKKKVAKKKIAKKKVAKAAKSRVASKKAVKSVWRAAPGRKKAVKKKVAQKKAAAPKRRPDAGTMMSPEVADLDRRIAIVRNNLRDLAEMASASSGASNEELTSGRIAEQEEWLRTLTAQRDALVRGKG